MSIASAIQTAQGRVAAAYTACNNKGATIPATANQNLSNLATTIETISTGGGGGSVESKDVDFIDYDGTLVASYTADEFAALTALPANPSHDGLIAQGWNWTLSDAKTHVASYKKLLIGQTYTTSDGKTRLYISIPNNDRLDVTLYFNQSAANGVTVDWGDSSATETSSSSGNTNIGHTYSEAGDYIISLDVTSGTASLGNNSSTYSVLGRISGISIYNNRTMLKKAHIGSGITTLGSYAFAYNYSLKEVTIPNTVTKLSSDSFEYCYSLDNLIIPNAPTSTYSSLCYGCYSLTNVSLSKSIKTIDNYTFRACYGLKHIIIPNGATKLGSYVFTDNPSLQSVILPSTVTSINASTFSSCYSLFSLQLPPTLLSIETSLVSNCYSLTSLTIPSGVTSIGTYAFSYCTRLKNLYLLPETPPTLTNTNTFSSIATDVLIYVPNGCLEAYQTASNWSTKASRMVEMPA